MVKNITDYGAFVDLGGVDGLLHVTDIAWRRVSHPTEVLSVGQTVTVQIIKINHDTQRISLGMKQLQTDPWEGVAAKYPVGVQFKGKVTNVTDYGAFVELEPGVEGLVHVSEMSWVKKNLAPVQAGHAGHGSRSAGAGSRFQQAPHHARPQADPGKSLDTASPPAIRSAATIEGEIKSITEFGLFIGLDNDIDGMVHLSDLSWAKPGEEAIKDYEKGQMVKAKVLDIDVEKERVCLGIKQLDGDPIEKAGPVGGASRRTRSSPARSPKSMTAASRSSWTTACKSFIRRADLARDRNDQRPERFGKGDKVDAMVTSVDKASPQGLALHQGARNGRGEGSRGAVRFVRLRRLAGRHPGRGAQEEDQKGRVSESGESPVEVRPANAAPGAFAWRGAVEPV